MSIRWRLPLTYAAIALIATVALGIVLLTTLRSYYAQAEWDYLFNNAQAVRGLIGALQDQSASEANIQGQLENIAFLSQVQIQWLDNDRHLIIDTGLPERDILSLGSKPTLAFAATREMQLTDTSTVIEPAWAAQGSESDRMFTVRILRDQVIGPAQDDVFIPAYPAQPDGFSLPARLTLFGYNLSDQMSTVDIRRSDQFVEVPLTFDSGQIGYVKLSQGPSYGSAILDGVARAWVLASTAAIIVAGLVGLYISQRISAPLLALTHITSQMSAGNLAVRATVTSKDEVGTLARSFNDMAQRVEETIVTLRRFVADAAHELHTPLTALRTNLELVNDAYQANEQGRFVASALTQVNRLEALTEDLLELSRLEANPVRESHAPVNLSALIRDSSELYASQAEQNDILFAVEMPDTDVYLRANESQLRRALNNLLENAIKFTPPGGKVHIGLCKEENGSVRLWVEDTGIGIPEHDFSQIFNRFHRGRNAFAYPGSGLGLAIVKAIADAHAGRVLAEPLSPGTRFILQFPG